MLGLEGVTELAEGVVVVIDRARPGWRLSPGWRLFFLARSFLGSFSAQPQIAGEAPPGSLKNRKARTSPHRPKVYTKGSAVRIRAIAGLVIGTAWRLVLVASPINKQISASVGSDMAESYRLERLALLAGH